MHLRHPYPERLTTISFFYTTEHLRVTGLAQGPSSGCSAVLRFELPTFRSRIRPTSSPTSWPLTYHFPCASEAFFLSTHERCITHGSYTFIIISISVHTCWNKTTSISQRGTTQGSVMHNQGVRGFLKNVMVVETTTSPLSKILSLYNIILYNIV